MTEGISKERLQIIRENLRASNSDGHADGALALADALLSECKELDPWLPIDTSIVNNKEYLFISESKRQRIDRFHPIQYATVNTGLRWQERPADRYTHYKELSEDPKE